MNIPFARVDRQFQTIRPEVLSAAESVFTHGKVLQGSEVTELEEQIAAMHGLPHAVAVNSGTDSLILALKSLDLKRGGRVAVTSLSFIASASAIVHAGGVPVFVDIDDYYQSQENALLELINNQQVDGIIAVHLYGQMMDLTRVRAAAKQRGIFVIEDAAQALGARRFDQPPGGLSDITCISFDPTKVIGAYGSGGAALTADPDLKDRLKRLRYHGSTGNGMFGEIGFNTQLATVQAALLCVKLKYADKWQARRIEIAEKYSRRLGDIPPIAVPTLMNGNVHNFHKYVIRLNGDRNRLMKCLADNSIGTKVHYAVPLHKQPCFAGVSETCGSLTNVETTISEILSLPIYPELHDEEVDYICEKVRCFFGN